MRNQGLIGLPSLTRPRKLARVLADWLFRHRRSLPQIRARPRQPHAPRL